MKTNYTPARDGIWDFACDSYGKVQHSRKACVYSVVRSPDGERIVKIAGQIQNWDDARLMARSPLLLNTMRRIIELACVVDDNAQARLDEIQTLAAQSIGDTRFLKPNGGGADGPLLGRVEAPSLAPGAISNAR
jgi:hypothetical protein